MPKLSEFFGIKVTVYPDEHGVPHFHAVHQDDEMVIGIQPLTVLGGAIRPREFGMVMEWAFKHQAELIAAWNALRAGRKPETSAPLN